MALPVGTRRNVRLPFRVCGLHRGISRIATKARGFVAQGPRDESEDDSGEAEFGSERRESCCASSASTLKGVGSHECDDRQRVRRTRAGAENPLPSCGEPAVARGNAGCPGGHPIPGGGMDGRARLSLANTGSPVWCRSARPEPIPRDNVEARPGRAGCGAAWATSVRHRRSPVSISSAVADALDGYRWLHETGYGAGDIVVAGDSAGGYLAFMTALSVSAAGLPKPAGAGAISPLTAACGTARDCPVFPPRAAAMFARYLARAHARITVNGQEGPLASPVAEDLRDMPPVMIHAGVDELLLATPS
jgi:alpha/beta hydrolase fold